MFSRVSIARLSPTVLVVGLWAQTLDPPYVVAQPPPIPPALQQLPAQQLPEPAVLKVEQLTEEQFTQLPDSAVIEFQGQWTTKGKLLAKIRQQRGAAAAGRAQASEARAKFEGLRAQFLQRQQAELDAAKAKFQAEIARLGQAGPRAQPSQIGAVQQKAAELCTRSKTASPAEQAQIEQQAGELLKQLQQVPR